MTFYAKWPPEHDEALKKHFAAGLSFAQISAKIRAEFGVEANYSRNAAIGRAHRLGLSQAHKPKKAAPPRPWEDAGKPRRTFFRHIEIEAGIYHAPTYKPRVKAQTFACDPVSGLRVADVVPLHLALIDLDPGQCRWPYGEGPYTFCGCHTFDGSSYCEPHAALSFGRGTDSERRATHGVAA
jgi:GcrA cell cycle regulator